MGGKHLKRVRAERAKVHLKKKILPKGQNVTQTAFTVKKIVAVEQLKKVTENEPVSNWNIPLKDLLIRLNHYNFTSRLNSLCGIKETLKKYPEILNGPHLKSIIEGVLILITDIEKKIRITAINLLSHIFSLISPNSIKPFYGILIVHLGCAMTHRTVSIQRDSLKFISVLLQYSPEALKYNFQSIIQNFVRILKNYLHDGHSGSLLLNESHQNIKITKTEILLKFYQFLSAGLYSNLEENELTKSRNQNINVLDNPNVSLRYINDQYKQIPSLSLFVKMSQNKEKALSGKDSEEFQSLCLLVVPLLFDTWTEFSPNKAVSECVISEDIGALLSVLLKILLLYYEEAVALKDSQMEDWFVSKYGPAFKKSFTSNFPYLSSSIKSFEGNYYRESSRTRNDFLLQNLIVCFLSYSFKIVNPSSQMETKMENYLSSALQMKNPTEIKILLKAIEVVLNASKYKKSNAFLSNIVAAHNTTNNPELQLGLSKALMQIVLNENDTAYSKDQSLKQWMKSLPDRLCKSQIFSEEIQTILKLINKPVGREILKEVELKGEEIMMNLSNIKIQGTTQIEGQKLIANILYRCNNTVLEEMAENKNLTDTLNPPELRNYILDIFSYKLKINQAEVAM